MTEKQEEEKAKYLGMAVMMNMMIKLWMMIMIKILIEISLACFPIIPSSWCLFLSSTGAGKNLQLRGGFEIYRGCCTF